jgi:hypothetical protein
MCRCSSRRQAEPGRERLGEVKKTGYSNQKESRREQGRDERHTGDGMGRVSSMGERQPRVAERGECPQFNCQTVNYALG